jgi:1-acyl-sn-glycerol-3-phosphate acyltransferase
VKSNHPLRRLERDGRAIGSYGFSRQCMCSIIHRLWRHTFATIGSENIPRNSSAILAVNQTTHLDPLFLALAVCRPIHFVGLDDHGTLEPWYTPLLYEAMGVIRATPNLARYGGHQFLSDLDDVVRYGELIGIFPEGRLELKHNRREIAPFHHGAAAIAGRYHIPVVPILMKGMESVMPHSTAHLRERIHIAPVTVLIGEAIVPAELCRKDCIRQAILDLRNDFPEIVCQRRRPQRDCAIAEVRPRNA